jgi:penicillin G amidase
MKPVARYSALALLLAAAVFGAAQGYLASKRPVRSGTLALAKLTAPVTVRYDDAGVPHIKAANEADLYRALGFVHAQDRLFQMELARRLARGELAEIFGPQLVETDRLFRTLRLREWADASASTLDATSAPSQALSAYLDGINQYQDTRPAPLEFVALGIPKRPFTPADTLSVSGYLAYSFATAFKIEPVLSFVRDTLGPDYLRAFDTRFIPGGVIPQAAAPTAPTAFASAQPLDAASLNAQTWRELASLSKLASTAVSDLALPQFEGSNAWAISGARTASGKPHLAGDPHIAFSLPSVWYEAHLSAPGFELYGHHTALVPVALLGLNTQFAWSLTMFQNDDIDLIREHINPANPAQAWQGDAKTGRWVDIESHLDEIRVKGAPSVPITLRRGPHGPIINDGFSLVDAASKGTAKQPIAMWWTLYESPPKLLDAMHALNRADTLPKARAAASQIHAPGLNVVWANAAGDIGWWAAAKLPNRPAGVNPAFILDAAKGEAEKPGWRPFSANPHEENPARGYIMSANHQPTLPAGSGAIPGYYNLPDRGIRLNLALADAGKKWTMADSQALQLESATGYGPRIVSAVLPALTSQNADEATLLDQLAHWDGKHDTQAIEPTLFNQLLYELLHAAMADELGDELFTAMLRLRPIDRALPAILADADSPWWDDRHTPLKETREARIQSAWNKTLAHLRTQFGNDPAQWTWGRAHTLTHTHPLGIQSIRGKALNAGPYPVPGGHETPNNFDNPIGPLPHAVLWGPSTRRVIDMADPEQSQGINPVGQSGVWGDAHYADQAAKHSLGGYRPHRLSEADITQHTRSVLVLQAP